MSRMCVSAFRWACLISFLTEVDNAVSKLRSRQYVDLKMHIGGGFYLSVSTGVWCVDIRRHFQDVGGDLRPTRNGVALRLHEYDALKSHLDDINTRFPSLADALPCYLRTDHSNHLDCFSCKECYPFLS
jgi:hypothetical protein